MTLAFFIQVLAGAVGGNVAGGVLSRFDLGPLGNTLTGLLGGLGGSQLLAVLAPGLGAVAAGNGMEAAALTAQIVGGGIGGTLLMLLVGLIKQAMVGVPAK